jgi:hypothetical protein
MYKLYFICYLIGSQRDVGETVDNKNLFHSPKYDYYDNLRQNDYLIQLQ